MIIKLLISTVLCLVFVQALYAADKSAQTLDQLLESASVEAGENYLNIDYTPSVVSVIKKEQLLLLGVNTLFEALDIIPGIQTSVSNIGIKKVIVRGVDSPNNFTFDKMKLQIDGSPIEMALFNNSSLYLDMPIQIIERIEILRGPASALYGNGAFSGVINVVTQKGSSSVFVATGSYDYYLGGLRFAHDIDDKTTIDISSYLQRSDKHIDVEEYFSPPVEHTQKDQYSTNEQLDDYAFFAQFKHDTFALRSRYKKYKTGNFYGWNERLETRDDLRREEEYFLIEASNRAVIATKTSLKTLLAYSNYSFVLDTEDYVSHGLIWTAYEFGASTKESSYRAELSIESSYFDSQEIKGGVEFSRVKLVDSYIDDNLSPYGKRALVKRGLNRDILAIFLNDTVALSRDLMVLVAIRGDYYINHKRVYPTAQLGAVYTMDDSLKIKFNYGRSFRAPSWIEQYTSEYGEGDGTREGNLGLEAESVDTFELAVILSSESRLRAGFNMYYSLFENVLGTDDRSDSDQKYSNHKDVDSLGAEFSLDVSLLEQDRLHLNLAYVESGYVSIGDEQKEQFMPTASRWMVKGYYTHFVTPSLVLSVLGKYIGEIPRNQQFDNRPVNRGVDEYFVADITLSYRFIKNLTLRASIKNLFDEQISYPSYYSRHDDGMPRERRNYLIAGEYRF